MKDDLDMQKPRVWKFRKKAISRLKGMMEASTDTMIAINHMLKDKLGGQDEVRNPLEVEESYLQILDYKRYIKKKAIRYGISDGPDYLSYITKFHFLSRAIDFKYKLLARQRRTS